MLYKDNTTKLLNLQDFEVEKIEETETETPSCLIYVPVFLIVVLLILPDHIHTMR